ncbi:MAG: hypothetical protein PVSMB8_10120 [Vulcanimicrobiaceae bacterium]
MQIAFARIATDATARARFACDPNAECEALAALEPRYVEYVARSLVEKRLHEVRRLLPHAAREPGFAARFRTFARDHACGGAGRHRADALAFARVLETTSSQARVDRLDLQARCGGRFAAVAIVSGTLTWWWRPTPTARLRTGAFAVWTRHARGVARPTASVASSTSDEGCRPR